MFKAGAWQARIKIQVKDNKTRTLISGLSFKMPEMAMNYGYGISTTLDTDGTWATWVLDKKRLEFRKSRMRDMELMDFALFDTFRYREMKSEEKEW
jgi:hypothetical protein